MFTFPLTAIAHDHAANCWSGRSYTIADIDTENSSQKGRESEAGTVSVGAINMHSQTTHSINLATALRRFSGIASCTKKKRTAFCIVCQSLSLDGGLEMV